MYHPDRIIGSKCQEFARQYFREIFAAFQYNIRHPLQPFLPVRASRP